MGAPSAVDFRAGSAKGGSGHAGAQQVVHMDRAARLWPQTERLRATLLASQLAGDRTLWESADEAAATLCRYLDMPTPGLWRDQMQTDGEFVVEPVKASSFYHIVGAILELDRALG